MEPWKIEVRQRPHMFLTDIWIFRRGNNNKVVVWLPHRDAAGQIIEEKEYDYGMVDLPASLTLPSDLVPNLLAAIIENGVKPPEQQYTAGKLEAVQAHLGDLRQLLKLK